MGLNSIAIAYVNPTLVYHPGQVISVKVLLSLDSPRILKDLKMKIRGKASVQWMETEKLTRRIRRFNRQNHSVRYTGEEIILYNKFNLIADETFLNNGDHVFEFSTQLPQNLPSSFKSYHGQVEYTLQAKANISWDFDKKANSVFTVVNRLNLNHLPNLKAPITLQKDKMFCCFCVRVGRPLTVVCFIPKTGFVPGERIPLTLEVDNESNVDICAVNCYIKRVIKFTSSKPSLKTKVNYEKLLTSAVTLGNVIRRSSKTFTEEIFVPDEIPYPYLSTCKIIQISYLLRVQFDAGDFHNDLNLIIPIEIGELIPLTECSELPTTTDVRQPDSPPPSYETLQTLDYPTTAPYQCGPSAPRIEISKATSQQHRGVGD